MSTETTGDDLPEIRVEAYDKIDHWRNKLDRTAKLKKRDVFERAAADLFLEAEHERDLRAVQAITDAVYFLGRDHTGLNDDDIQYIMDGAKAKAERPTNDPTETAVEGISLENFYAYMPMHNYIYVPTREPWPAASVNARLAPMPVLDGKGKQKLDDKGRPEFISASKWLDQNRPVAQMTWAPGEPLIIADRLISHGGWIHRPGEACLNVYHPPTIDSGNAAEADPWLEHVHRVYPNDAEHIIACLAHRVQRPAEKINHALVLGGKQGTGKDTLLEPIKHAVGPWNFIEVMPSHMLGRFNGFLKAVVLRINEARDLGEVNRYAWHDHMKAYTASPPDVLRVDEKNLREHSILNCCGVIITTNHKTDGIYLPPDDRRHYVAWCDLSKEDFATGYWNSLWGWYGNGGYHHVAAYLRELDISTFDPRHRRRRHFGTS